VAYSGPLKPLELR